MIMDWRKEDAIKKKLAEKYKKDALDWYSENKKKEVSVETIDVEEAKALDQEIEMVNELITVINESSLDEERQRIFTGILKAVIAKLEVGSVPENLPSIVSNLYNKEELKVKVGEVTKKYAVDGSTYFYLWGLENE